VSTDEQDWSLDNEEQKYIGAYFFGVDSMKRRASQNERKNVRINDMPTRQRMYRLKTNRSAHQVTVTR
jgi:hypothetical protein